jgi:CHAT domain-containing protein
MELGDYRRAADLHEEALSLRRQAGDADREGNSLNNLGKVYLKLGDRKKGRDYFEQALGMHRKTGNRHMLARTLRNLGELDFETGDYAAAERYLDESLETCRAIQDPNGEAAALTDLARLERARGGLDRAHALADEAMAVLESLRLSVASPKLRASFFGSARDVEELNIDVLMRMNAAHPGNGLDSAALLATERGRARSLLEMLGETAGEIRQGVDTALRARERELEQLISSKADLRTRLLGAKHTDVEVQALAKDIDSLTVELEQAQSRVRAVGPRYASLIQPAPLNLEEIQAEVLDSNTVLLEYALGKDKSFLWVVTPSSMKVFDLPPREAIESAARRVYDLVTARNRKPAKETSAARAARIKQADAEFPATAAQASKMLLEPAASLLQDKRLLVVAEGVLQYLPFAALPDPGVADKAVPLAVNHEIAIAPSASVVAVLRKESSGRKPAEKALAVLADPVFSADDARISRQKQTPAAAPVAKAVGEASRAAREDGAAEFTRLRFSRTEAEEISRLTPADSTLKALDFDASRETVMRSDLGQYRIVHFATHSLLDPERPELSGVVLSLFDRYGRPQNGFLRLIDIYNLRLGSDLVVLSACQTALGGEIKGEGLIGLTRGFLYAGAPRVVATLWEIDDRTTAEVMRHFYEGMLSRGETPAAALRAAQVEMSKSKGWDAPYFWAAFTLHGEWR